MTPSNGIALIAHERERQINQEGWTPEHDDEHDDGDLAMAAVCYAAIVPVFRFEDCRPPGNLHFVDPWPWDETWDKRRRIDNYGADNDGALIPIGQYTAEERIRNLVKAGALIAAEIDRLLRAQVAEAAEKAQKAPL